MTPTMLLTATIFLGSTVVFALLALHGEAYGECYTDSPESLRLRVAHHRWTRENAHLASDHA
jgi:hypothetical protein